MKKTTLCVMLCLCMVCMSLCGCSEGKTEERKQGKKEEKSPNKVAVTVLYNRADTLNPYAAKTELNRNVSLLLYDPLIRLDNSFNVDKCIAESIELIGNKCTVTLKKVKFSDGAPVTSHDVIYTYNQAKKSGGSYAARFYEVISVEAADENTAVFTLDRIDPYFDRLLDFPIIKTDTAGKKDNDGVETAPVGCGRYVLSEDKTELLINRAYYKKQGDVTNIKLLHAPDDDSISHYVEVGAASLYYTDISSGSIIRMSGKKTDVNLNDFVYIGINENVGALRSKNLRYAISSAINRTDICKNAYYNNAVCATGFFNPAISEVSPVQTINPKSDLQITVENLDKIGYNSLNKEGYYVSQSGKVLTFSLLVNSENVSRVRAARLIASQLKAAGIKINIVEKPYENYLRDIKSNNFELYLGETEILANMDFSPLAVYGGSVAYGLFDPKSKTSKGKESNKDTGSQTTDSAGETEPQNEQSTEQEIFDEPEFVCAAAIKSFYEGEGSLLSLAGTLLTQMPQIPICYRTGKLFYSSSISGTVEASQSDIYYSVNSYIVN